MLAIGKPSLLICAFPVQFSVNAARDRKHEMSNAFMQEAIRQATENVRAGRGGPFAAVVVKDGHIIAAGANSVTSTIYWARPDRVYYAATARDAADAGFDDSFIYEEMKRAQTERRIPLEPMMREAGLEPFREWNQKGDRIRY